jgi:starch phosphorylase
MLGTGGEVSRAIHEDVRTGLDPETLCHAVCDHLYFFAQQVMEIRAKGYDPRAIYRQNAELRGVMDLIGCGALSRGDPNLFRHLVDGLLSHDWFMLLADYQSYVDCQTQVSELWHAPKSWTRKSIINVARMGKFSSDRSIREYCDRVWQVKPLSSRNSTAS